MKLDGETVRCHGSVDLKSDQKAVEDNKNGFIDSIQFRPEIELERKEQSGDFCKLKSSEGKADQLQYTVNDLTSNDEEKLRNFVSPIQYTRSSLEIESFEKDSVFYVDKSVMEAELPELVVCYKENTYHVVKDICVDEGIPAKDKFLFDTDVDEEQLRTFLKSEDINGEVEKGGDPVSDDSISLKEKGSRNEISGESDMNKSTAEGVEENGEMQKVGNGASRETFSLSELLAMAAKPKSERNSVDRAEVQMKLENTILTRSHDSEESENVNEKASSANLSTVCKAEKSDFSCKEESLQIPDSDCAGKGSNHGHNEPQVSSPPESAAEKSEETLESQNTLEISESNRRTRDTSKSITSESNCSAPHSSGGSGDGGTEPFSSQLQYSQGESSFSAAGPVSGLITYSGPIAYSGSLSLRSDSSTTSTRSFAFPILQSEWNSSPVRMAKADRRCNRKHGWRQAILCCRF